MADEARSSYELKHIFDLTRMQQFARDTKAGFDEKRFLRYATDNLENLGIMKRATRKHHAGWHKVELTLNGAIMAEGGFNLVL